MGFSGTMWGNTDVGGSKIVDQNSNSLLSNENNVGFKDLDFQCLFLAGLPIFLFHQKLRIWKVYNPHLFYVPYDLNVGFNIYKTGI